MPKKLTDEQVTQLKALLATETDAKLSRTFGISREMVSVYRENANVTSSSVIGRRIRKERKANAEKAAKQQLREKQKKKQEILARRIRKAEELWATGRPIDELAPEMEPPMEPGNFGVLITRYRKRFPERFPLRHEPITEESIARKKTELAKEALEERERAEWLWAKTDKSIDELAKFMNMTVTNFKAMITRYRTEGVGHFPKREDEKKRRRLKQSA